ncbi:MAG: HDOD domain-containing protein [Deltaproteobacteria bacterium]|nr:HDOD domain-containing protein [Deltaproteobacteria bacterium]
MDSTGISRKLAEIKDLPSLPVVAQRVLQIIQNPKSSAMVVAKAISLDEALTTEVLRTANSAYFGFPRKINTITHAIVLLGFAHIKNMVLTATIVDMFQFEGTHDGFDRRRFWKHSLACAITAELIARSQGMQNLEEVFICGLLHDIGRLVMDINFNAEFTEAIALAREEECLLLDAEKKVMGLNHPKLGGLVANKWNLGLTLTRAIKFHHKPLRAGEFSRTVSIVHLADALCHAVGIGSSNDDKVPCLEREAWEQMGFDRQNLKHLFTEMEHKLAVAQDFLPNGKKTTRE